MPIASKKYKTNLFVASVSGRFPFICHTEGPIAHPAKQVVDTLQALGWNFLQAFLEHREQGKSRGFVCSASLYVAVPDFLQPNISVKSDPVKKINQQLSLPLGALALKLADESDEADAATNVERDAALSLLDLITHDGEGLYSMSGFPVIIRDATDVPVSKERMVKNIKLCFRSAPTNVRLTTPVEIPQRKAEHLQQDFELVFVDPVTKFEYILFRSDVNFPELARLIKASVEPLDEDDQDSVLLSVGTESQSMNDDQSTLRLNQPSEERPPAQQMPEAVPTAAAGISSSSTILQPAIVADPALIAANPLIDSNLVDGQQQRNEMAQDPAANVEAQLLATSRCHHKDAQFETVQEAHFARSEAWSQFAPDACSYASVVTNITSVGVRRSHRIAATKRGRDESDEDRFDTFVEHLPSNTACSSRQPKKKQKPEAQAASQSEQGFPDDVEMEAANTMGMLSEHHAAQGVMNYLNEFLEPESHFCLMP